jgi:hypothetical protein
VSTRVWWWWWCGRTGAEREKGSAFNFLYRGKRFWWWWYCNFLFLFIFCALLANIHRQYYFVRFLH